MAYFKNIHSLAELKKEYRRLALENHPDKGGSTDVMQQINVEFERLHEIWKNDTTVSANASGYENDYAGASAKEYTDFVYNEYRWKGRNYQGQHAPEIVELVRNWMKETYPKYKFSVSRHNYNSIHIYLVKADFEAFKKDKGVVFHHDVNHYNIDGDQTLTDRAKEVTLKSATKLFSVLLASKRPLITELADKLRLKYPLLPTISPCPTMRLEAIRSIIPISCRRYPKSV